CLAGSRLAGEIVGRRRVGNLSHACLHKRWFARKTNMHLSPQFEKALAYATRIHGGQLRKKTRIPYIAHILGVAAIAMEYDANETEAVGALLHDAVEDCGGAKRLRDIERK